MKATTNCGKTAEVHPGVIGKLCRECKKKDFKSNCRWISS